MRGMRRFPIVLSEGIIKGYLSMVLKVKKRYSEKRTFFINIASNKSILKKKGKTNKQKTKQKMFYASVANNERHDSF